MRSYRPQPEQKPFGHFQVVGNREYRGHEQGTHFVARYEPPMQRAINRGDIKFLEWIVPDLPPEHHLPPGWPEPAETQVPSSRPRKRPQS